MYRHSRLFRLTALLATTSLAAAGVIGSAPPLRAQDAVAPLSGDPPSRVGRLARLDGTVSTHGADSTQWTPAVLNFPFASGDALWTQPQAQADVEIGSSVATLADSTELDLATLDDHALVASEPQGAIFLDLRDVQPGDSYTINTPRGAVQIAADGEYEILAGDTATPTRVAVVRGAAQFTSGALVLRAGPGQMAVATGDQDVQGDIEPLNSYDPFLTAMLARNSALPHAPQAVQNMTGVQTLAQYGSWQQSPQYGQVWYPQVAPDWVPYRDGSWSYVAPWGWTWVDNEPWGFAPFHYGRWAQLDHRWCWVPTQQGAPYDPQPTYAPALVDFVAAGAVAGVAAGILAASLSSGRGDVGWIPLGPREAYEPPYGGSRRYQDRLNWGGGWHRPAWEDRQDRNQINHTTIINNHNTTNNVFINRGALTIAPAAAMARSQQIRPLAHGIDTAGGHAFQSASVQSLRGPLPIRPVAETRGLTPQAARHLGLPAGPAHPPSPGPAINPALLHAAAAPGGRIPFRGAAAPAGTHMATRPAPGPAVQPAAASPRPVPRQLPGRPAPPQHPNVAAVPAHPELRPAAAGHTAGPAPGAPASHGPAIPEHRPAPIPHAPPASRASETRPPTPRIEARPMMQRPVGQHLQAPRAMQPQRPAMARPAAPQVPGHQAPGRQPPGHRPDHP